MDTTGNIGGPFTDNITLDTQPPVLAILDGPDEYTNESTLTVSISLDGTSDLSLTGSCGVQSLTNQSTGSLDLGNLAEGTYSDCELEAFDLAANGSGIQNIPTFTVDRTVPTSASLVLNGGASNGYGKHHYRVGGSGSQWYLSILCPGNSKFNGSFGQQFCWKPADNSTSFSQSESFALSTDYNVKTLISWFKDRAGNSVSTSSNIKRVDPNRPPIIGYGRFQVVVIPE